MRCSPSSSSWTRLPVELTADGTEVLAAANRALVVVERTLSSTLGAAHEQRLCTDLLACAAALQQLGGEPGTD